MTENNSRLKKITTTSSDLCRVLIVNIYLTAVILSDYVVKFWVRVMNSGEQQSHKYMFFFRPSFIKL